MIIYHGAIPKELGTIKPKAPVDVLLSYAVYKKTEWLPWWGRLFIDSGAYSVWKANKKIDIKEYHSYIKSWGDNPNIVFAGLDVIGDPDQSFENYKWLSKRVPHVIPTLHFGEPISILKKYITRTNYIGIGASVGRSTMERQMFLDRIFMEYPDPEEVGFHGFGVTDPKLMVRYPWISLDSTRAFRWAIGGRIETPFGRKKNFNVGHRYSYNDHPFRKLGENELKKLMKWAEGHGINFDKVTDHDLGRLERTLCNLRTIEYKAENAPADFKGHSNSHVLGLKD